MTTWLHFSISTLIAMWLNCISLNQYRTL